MMLENKIHLKKYLCLSFLVLFIFMILGNLFFFYQYRTYTKNYNYKLGTVISLVKEKYPKVKEEELIAILNGKDIPIDDIFHEYGIDMDKESFILENDQKFNLFCIIYNVLLLAATGSLLFLYLQHEKKQYKEIKKLVACMEEINKKNYAIDIDENSEDELSILKNEIYKTMIMLKEVASNSEEDKLKLKDSLSDISHQLKTPLTSINIMLDNILEDKEMDNDTKEKFIVNIKREITNISSLVGELLKLSKFDANVVTMEKKEVSLKEVVRLAISNVEMMAELKNIEIKVECSNDGKIQGDLTWQVEAITNILKNCLEHSKEESRIFIKIDANKVYSFISIKDYGKGIAKKDLPHIFERFYKGKSSSSDSVGIGLSLAKTIIEKNNGTITVDSKEGYGTTFTIKYYLW